MNLVDLLEVHQAVASSLVREVIGARPPDEAQLGQVLDRCAAFLRESVTPYAMAQVAYRDLGAVAAPAAGSVDRAG